MRISAVLFDVDGTLVDTVDMHAAAWHHAFQHFGKTLEVSAVRQQIGKGGDQLMPVFLTPAELATFGDELEAYRGELFRKDYLPRTKAFPRVRELFLRVEKDGTRIALASSAPKQELEHFKNVLNVADLLDADTNADDAESSKPEPDIFLAALRRLGHPAPAETLVIGDTPWDAIAARKAQLRIVGLLCGGFPEDDLRREGCVEIYQSPADLLERYDESLLSARPGP